MMPQRAAVAVHAVLSDEHVFGGMLWIVDEFAGIGRGILEEATAMDAARVARSYAEMGARLDAIDAHARAMKTLSAALHETLRMHQAGETR